ncbi:MAG: hypothetical protein B6D56_08105 [Candidatus Omnitrophica bacterium 4484_70.1]|nr:MAG: hypothetical protein B6D56_08105 [Candidatus Omnitrophica bacterium 4484_70.1]
MKAYRHGDVIIVEIEKLPEGVKKLNHLVLAEGEVTGHKHQIIKGDAELYEKDGRLYLRVITPSVIDHPEHGQGVIEPGIYGVDKPQEFDYFKADYRRVRD